MIYYILLVLQIRYRDRYEISMHLNSAIVNAYTFPLIHCAVQHQLGIYGI